MDKISVFGAGFILGKFAETFPDECVVIHRESNHSQTPRILYGISTIDNYNIFTNPTLDIETNLIKFMNVLDYNRRIYDSELDISFVSSWFVYGNTELPAKETSPCNPTGGYSITKLCAEQLLASYCKTYNIKYRIMRLANIIGAGDKKISRKKNAMQYMIRELSHGREIELYQNGALRDFMDVRDCVQAIRLVVEKGSNGEIYNVANGKGYNVRDLVGVAWQEAGYTGKIKDIPVPEFHKIVQTPKMWMDIKKLKSLGYVQQHDIAQTVRELVHHYQNEKNEKTENS